MLRSSFAIVGFIACAALPVPGVGAPAKCDPAAFRVVVDVGHTAEVPGAISARGVPEYAFNLRLAQTIDRHLAAAGFVEARPSRHRRAELHRACPARRPGEQPAGRPLHLDPP